MKKPTTTLMIWKVPIELKAKFKMACLKRKISMRDAIILFLQKWNAGDWT